MAKSPAHVWGQLIGNYIENLMLTQIKATTDKLGLYLDTIGPRKARRGKKVSWIDHYGNSHDLDFVIERNGSEEVIGEPVGFIEVAWRRYTKHSKNKAQEIQGAIMPLLDEYRLLNPFIGAIIAGEFTSNAITQLESRGFTILYFSYHDVISAFSEIGIDGHWDENTSTADILSIIAAWNSLPDQSLFGQKLLESKREEIDNFLGELEKSAMRKVSSVMVNVLSGKETELGSIIEAVEYINTYSTVDSGSIFKYDIVIRYNNGDRIECTFRERADVLKFLESYN